MAKLLRQVTLRKDATEYDSALTLSISANWLTRTGLKRGDFINIYEEDAKTLRVTAERNPFGTPEEIPQPGRRKSE